MCATAGACIPGRFRRCAAPRRPAGNNLSHANKRRPAELGEKLFWAVLTHLQGQCPGFGQGHKGRRLAARFRAAVPMPDVLSEPSAL